MIPEIGIMLGLFVLTRLVPATWRRLSALTSAICAIVTILVVADLVAQGMRVGDLAAVFTRERSPTSVALSPNASAPTPTPNTASVTKADGGPITTELGYGIALAKNSSLHREWIAIHDAAMPVEIEGTPGVDTIYVSEKYSGSYQYEVKGKIRTNTAVSAFELRFLTFDVWGNHSRTLSLEEVRDMKPGDTFDLKGQWSLYSENEAEQHYASIGFVARVRLADGRVVEANYAPVLEEAQKFSAKFSAADLEPKKERPADGQGNGKNTSEN